MKNKRKILAVSMTLMVLILVACDKNNNENNNNDVKVTETKNNSAQYIPKTENQDLYKEVNIYQEYNTYYNLKHAMDEAKESLENIVDISKLVEMSDAKEKYDTGDHETSAYTSKENDSYLEIASIKLKNTDELIWAMQKASDRAKALKESGIIQDIDKEVIIEINGGVLTMVVSKENALQISEAITMVLK